MSYNYAINPKPLKRGNNRVVYLIEIEAEVKIDIKVEVKVKVKKGKPNADDANFL